MAITPGFTVPRHHTELRLDDVIRIPALEKWLTCSVYIGLDYTITEIDSNGYVYATLINPAAHQNDLIDIRVTNPQ